MLDAERVAQGARAGRELSRRLLWLARVAGRELGASLDENSPTVAHGRGDHRLVLMAHEIALQWSCRRSFRRWG